MDFPTVPEDLNIITMSIRVSENTEAIVVVKLKLL